MSTIGRQKGPKERGEEARETMRRALVDRFWTVLNIKDINNIAGMVESHVYLAVLRDREARARKRRK